MAEGKEGEQVEKLSRWFSHAVGGIAKIRLSGGVVGRMAHVTIVGSVALAFVSGASAVGANPWVCGGVLFIMALWLYQGMKSMADYAKKNPLTATMEGAEINIHQQIKLSAQATKTQGTLPAGKRKPIIDPEQPPLLLEQRELEEPDKQIPIEGISRRNAAKEE